MILYPDLSHSITSAAFAVARVVPLGLQRIPKSSGHRLVAGALDADPEEGRGFGIELGLAEARSYGDWTEMLSHESKREDKLDLVTIATPNSTQFEITKAFLEQGFNQSTKGNMKLRTQFH